MCSHFNVVKALLQLKAAWGVWAGNSNATTTCSPPLFPSLLSPPDCILCTGSEGAAAAECSVGHLAEQQQRHHGVLCMGGRHMQPQRAPHRPVRIVPPLAVLVTLDFRSVLDLTNVNLFGPLPSLASLTGLTHLAIFMDGDISHAGTLDGLAWLSSLTNLQTLFALQANVYSCEQFNCHSSSALSSILAVLV
ncbi:unnamed protein product [Closterium sp. NIES-65]|nr:unnamed protein product [Closterium sp. NIES-65]